MSEDEDVTCSLINVCHNENSPVPGIKTPLPIFEPPPTDLKPPPTALEPPLTRLEHCSSCMSNHLRDSNI